jgi:hypothetical protein
LGSALVFAVNREAEFHSNNQFLGKLLSLYARFGSLMLKYFALCALTLTLSTGAVAQSWSCYGGNPQHTGLFTGASQSASLVHWQASLDDDRGYYGGEVLIHYAAPMVTSLNTVVHGYRFTASGTGTNIYDNWRMIGRNGSTGAVVWSLDTDYSAAVIWPQDWTSVYPTALVQVSGSPTTAMAAAGAGGSILVRTSADTPSSTVNRYVFYTNLSDFNNNKAGYSVVKICTPLTADKAGNVYFGYLVSGSLPSGAPALGTGGVARVNTVTGVATYKSVQGLGIDSNLSRPALNAAPALSNDGTSIYVALTGGDNMLAKLDAGTLNPTAQVILKDPSIPAGQAYLINESSGSPMVGPDGHVFMGVFGNQWRESHGWMLQFDSDLNANNSAGKRFPAGAFGWDDTASVVPANIVPSYRGHSSYLICTKYNNYDMGGDPGADGSNHIAVLDPGSDSKSKDRQSGIPVMNEIALILGPSLIKNDPSHPQARYEWCINSVAIDVPRKSAIINSEDGHMYRWSFVTNSVVESLDLQPATGEAYTSTAIGPDGQIYAINNAILFAIGSTKANSVSVYQGTAGVGTVQDIWYLDGSAYSTGSVSSALGPVAAIEADFTLNVTNPTALDISVYAGAALGCTGQVFAYNFATNQFVLAGSQQLSQNQAGISESITTNAAQFIGPGGQVRILVRAIQPSRRGLGAFVLRLDLASCGAH